MVLDFGFFNKSWDGEVLLLKGERSSYVDDRGLIEAKGFFPNIILKHVKNASHWLHVDNTEQFLYELVGFISVDS